MKPIVDFHLHSTGSDGKLPPRKVVERAVENGLEIICFTDHCQLPKEIKEAKREIFFNEDYVAEIKNLKNEFKNKIAIYFGSEFDWLENHKEYISKEIKKRKYDYVIGSVHFINFNQEHLPINYDKESLVNNAEKIGGVKEFVKEYYKQLRLMINSDLFDCVGHLDIIKKFNENLCLFSENEIWYKKEILKTLNKINIHKSIIEINTSGLRHPVAEQYPSKWIIKEARKRNIPITIGSDGHEEVSQGLERGIELAKEIGYDSVAIFQNRKRKYVEI